MRAGALLVLLALAVAGCGDDGGSDAEGAPDTSGDGGGGEVELSVAFEPDPPVSGQAVVWVLTVRNDSAEPATLTFSSGQRGDVMLLDAGGEEAYRWAAGHSFTQAVSQQELAPGQEVTYRLEEATLSVPAGDYELVATLAAEPQVGPDRQQVQIR